MNKIKIELPKAVLKIFEIIKEYGAESFVVGGCVRDSIIKREIHDWDICSPVPVCELAVMFREKGYCVIETGLQHGTITIMIDGEGYEITTYRRDGDYSDGRHPNYVEFVSDLEEDLARRSFTINAMAYNQEVGLVDPFGGLEDIENKTIRCVGNAEDRFKEDALRILRAIRFASVLGFEIENKTSEAIMVLKDKLDLISMERINSEFCKIINSDMPGDYLDKYRDVFFLFIPELIPNYDVYRHSIHALYNYANTYKWWKVKDKNDIIVRLALFFHDIGKPYCKSTDEKEIDNFYKHAKIGANMTNEIMRRMKFDNTTRELVVELIHYHNATLVPEVKNVRRWLNILGEQQFRRLLEVNIFDINAQAPQDKWERIHEIEEIKCILEKVLKENLCYTLKDLAISGRDLIQIGYKPGKELGKTLNYLLNAVIDGDLDNDKEILLQIARCNLSYESNSACKIPRMNVSEYME